jgi:hypothetical protein
VQPGVRVVVPFGKKKLYSGIVYYLHILRPETTYQIRKLLAFWMKTDFAPASNQILGMDSQLLLSAHLGKFSIGSPAVLSWKRNSCTG